MQALFGDRVDQMTDSNGQPHHRAGALQFRPLPLVLLTELEAAAYLRLNADREGDGVHALRRLVQHGEIRPALVGCRRRFAIEELDRFIRDKTASYGKD